MTNQLLLQNAEQYVRQLFATRMEETFSYHSIGHTEGVVKAATLMADHYQLPEEERLILLLSAWFHDTGYSKGKAQDHEAASQRIAFNYLQSKEIPGALVEKVVNGIGATRMPQSPQNLLEKILCDADLFHLGTEDFKNQSKLLRKELKQYNGEELNKKEWRHRNIQFLQKHQYFTDYARQTLEPVKQQNLQALMEKDNGNLKTRVVEEKPTKANKTPVNPSTTNPAEEKIKKEKEKEKESRTDRGVGTMFRIMSDNHVSLSQMADSKANIMISVNTILLSILVSVLFSKLQYYTQFIIPTIILCTVSLCAIIFAILATRPTVNRGTFTHEDVQQKKINLLFFGNFFKMELPDYEWAMKEMMNDREYLYGSMIKDIYYLGKVLAKKYKFLRLSYNIFMFGLVLSIIAFIIAFIISAD